VNKGVSDTGVRRSGVFEQATLGLALLLGEDELEDGGAGGAVETVELEGGDLAARPARRRRW